MKTWEARAAAYDRSFAKLCVGPIDRLLDDTGSGSLMDAGFDTGTLVVVGHDVVDAGVEA